MEDIRDAGWSFGRQNRCGLVIWKTLQMRAGHMEDITDAGWSYGRHYRCGQVIWKTLQMRAGHMEDITDADWSFGRQYRLQEWQGSRRVKKQAGKVAIKAHVQEGQAGIGNTGSMSGFGRLAITV
jgi:hypothetical protein